MTRFHKYLITVSITGMLANSPISPTIPVVDLDRAKRFYETTLGLKPVPANNDITPLAQLRLNVAKALV